MDTGLKPPFHTITVREWHHFAITKDSLLGSIYLDGKLMNPIHWVNHPYDWTRVDLGAQYYTFYSGFFTGKIDNLRITKTIKTAEEIYQDATQNAPMQADDNTILLVQFDQEEGHFIRTEIGPDGAHKYANWASGRFGNALAFDGVSAMATIPLNIPNTMVTVEYWFYIEKPENRKAILSLYGDWTSSHFIFTDTTGMHP
jgi:hypothetical protein